MAPPPHGPPLTGREAELAVLRAAVEAVADGRGGIVWIEGEPGIGKSELITATVAEATARRCTAYRGAAVELERRLPLRALLGVLGPEASAGIVAHLRLDGAAAAAVEAVRAAVDRLCAAGPVVLALDDLHWADNASLLAWHRLSIAAGELPLLLVSACRPVPVRSAVRGLRRGLTSRGAAVVTPGPLTDDEIAGVVGRLAGGTPDDHLGRVLAAAGGNPRYAGELLDALVRESLVRVDGGAATYVGPPDDLPAPSLAARILDFLSPEAMSALRIGAVLGVDFTVADLSAVARRPAGTLLSGLDEAISAGLLAAVGDRLAFRHGLIRHALYAATPLSVRTALHLEVARALADAGRPAERVATHLVAVPEALDGWAVDWLVTHGGALADRAPRLAADLLADAARRCAGDPRYEPILRGLARALSRLNRLDEAEAIARHARVVSTDPAGAAELALILGSILFAAGRYAEALPVLDEAMARPSTPPLWRARLLAYRAKVLPYAGRREEGAAQAHTALDEGRRLADRITLGHAWHALYALADRERGVACADRALEAIGDLPEAADLRITLLANRAYNLAALGRVEPADRSMREALRLAERVLPCRLPEIRVQTASRRIDAGSWDDAWTELAPLTGHAGLVERLIRLGGMAFVAAHRDDRTASGELLRAADALTPPTAYLRGSAALLYMARAVDAEQRGGPEAAAAVLAGTVSIEDGPDLYERHLWLPDLVRLALSAGDDGLARAAVAAAEADATGEALPRRVTAARRARAVLEDDAAALLALAGGYRAATLPLLAGQASEEAAVALARAGEASAARAALTEAVRSYLDLGAAWDVRRADARLRTYGVRRGPHTVRRRPTAGWAALTPTEEHVVALVAQGRSNPDIAAEMLLSRRTVQAHVSNILAKLGYASRLEIAREAVRRQS